MKSNIQSPDNNCKPFAYLYGFLWFHMLIMNILADLIKYKTNEFRFQVM